MKKLLVGALVLYLSLPAICSATSTSSSGVVAEGFPKKPVTIVLPFQVGGANDVIIRVLANQMSEIWKQPVIVINRPGADGSIGVESVVRAPADGYTLLAGTTSLSINPALTKKQPYDVMRDLVPVSQLVVTPNVLVVHPSVPAKNVRELTALAKARPGGLTGASAGSGTSAHLSLELYKSLANVKITHVAYKGSGPAVIGTMSGEVDLTFEPSAAVIQHVASGKLRALAVTTSRRFVTLPQVPTMEEAGVKGYEAAAWSSLLVPAGTPPAIVNALHKCIIQALKSSAVQAVFEKIGGEPIGSSPEEFALYLEREIAKWRQVVRDAGIKPE
jgi:tripartite-type tricarboxylate transporter receptor subunit TctC